MPIGIGESDSISVFILGTLATLSSRGVPLSIEQQAGWADTALWTRQESPDSAVNRNVIRW